VEPLIQLRNLGKSIEAGPNKFFLLRRVDLDIHSGEFVTIMGPSGVVPTKNSVHVETVELETLLEVGC
jgi:ABC-type dipeptide/oligopeptide/nickel transport system ATPase subunit